MSLKIQEFVSVIGAQLVSYERESLSQMCHICQMFLTHDALCRYIFTVALVFTTGALCPPVFINAYQRVGLHFHKITNCLAKMNICWKNGSFYAPGAHLL